MRKTALNTLSNALAMVALIFFATLPAHAAVRLASDWRERSADGKLIPFDQEEGFKMERSARQLIANQLSAIPTSPKELSGLTFDTPFQLYIDETKYYIQPAMFMAKSRPDEICHPIYNGKRIYKCQEGQRHTEGCNLLFFNSVFENVGVYPLKINVPYQYFCNAIPAIGTANKAKNELLVTVQYFPIDREAASKISEVGSGWIRQTILVRVNVVDGKIVLEQDDRCLGNPNAIEAIADARAVLKKCVAGSN